ncbi:MAG TPA: hypothetical protein VMT55_01545, partial [Candidatus Sulfotelmatobacter sp.]|nr:hypothetical protein [Candidatus Sulfotelmatobacter sp.]
MVTGPLLTPIANAIVEQWYSSVDTNANFGQSDLSVDQARVLDQAASARRTVNDEILSQDEKEVRAMNDLDNQQWETIAKLDDKEMIKYGQDGFWNLNETAVNQLRDELTGLQNRQRLLVMLSRGRQALRRVIGRLTQGLALGDGLVDSSDLDNLEEGRLLAFELKKTALNLKIEEHNKENTERLRLEKAWIMSIGPIAAVAAIAVTGGLGVLSLPVFGLIMSGASALSALGNMIFHWTNPVDQSIAQSGDFYAQALKKITRNNAVNAADAIDKLYAEARAEVDSLGNNSHVDMGSDQWGLDATAFISANTQVTKLLILIKFITMLEQAKNDMKNIILAATTGVSAADELDFVKSGLRALDADLRSALGLKAEAVKDVVGAHNRSVLADKELLRSEISFGINVGGMALGGAIGAGEGAAGKAGSAF